MQMWYFNENVTFIYTWKRKAAVVCTVKSLPEELVQCLSVQGGGELLPGACVTALLSALHPDQGKASPADRKEKRND